MSNEMISDLGINLILLGGPSDNYWTQQIQSTLPVNRKVYLNI